MDALLSAAPPFVAYCLVQGITPGPANLCSLSTTMRHGTAAALRQWVGLVIGFLIVALASVTITWSAREWFDQLLPAFSVLGALYVVWLAWKMLHPAHEGNGATWNRPTVSSGVLIQVTNAKIALLCLTALVSFVIPYTQDPGALIGFALVIPLTGVSCNLIWIFAGARLRTWYERHQRAVDAIMAAMLLLCALEMVLPLLAG